jgi:hypothetical protein
MTAPAQPWDFLTADRKDILCCFNCKVMVPMGHKRTVPADFVCNTCLNSRFAYKTTPEKRDAQFAAAVAAGKEEQFALQKVMKEEYKFFLESKADFVVERRMKLGESQEEALKKWKELLKAELDKLENMQLDGMEEDILKIRE